MTPNPASKAKKPTPMQIIETVSHPSRWMLLQALRAPMTAQTLAEEVDLTVANIIYHMRFLVDVGVVKITMDPDYKSRQVYHRKPFLAQVAVDFDVPGTATVSMSRSRRVKA